MSSLKQLWWPLRSRSRLAAVTTIVWAVLGFVVVAILQLSYAGYIRPLESLFGFVGGGIGGWLWSLAMWEFMLKARVQRILAAEAEAQRAEA